MKITKVKKHKKIDKNLAHVLSYIKKLHKENTQLKKENSHLKNRLETIEQAKISDSEKLKIKLRAREKKWQVGWKKWEKTFNQNKNDFDHWSKNWKPPQIKRKKSYTYFFQKKKKKKSKNRKSIKKATSLPSVKRFYNKKV